MSSRGTSLSVREQQQQQQQHALTAEQVAVIREDIAPGRTLIVNAFAGSGKTSTILARIERRTYPVDRPVLYVAFNQTTQQEMQKRAGKTAPVDSRTYHSLALQYVQWALDRRRVMIDPMKPGGLTGYTAAARILRRYWKDDSEVDGFAKEPQESHVERGETSGDLAQARRAWHRMLKEPDPAWTHDATLKFLCMGGAESERWLTALYSEMIVDEAQDVQGVLMHWLLSLHRVPLLLVGDGHQSIYSFTGARNAIERATEQTAERGAAKSLRLTASFRFGPLLAQCATTLLHRSGLLSPDISITGVPSRTGTVLSNRGRNPLALGGPMTCIARSNATIFTFALEALASGRHVRFVGRSREIIGSITKLLDRYPSKRDAEKRLKDLCARASMRTESPLGGSDDTTAQPPKRPRVDGAARGTSSANNSNSGGGGAGAEPLNETERDEMEKLQMITEFGHAKVKQAIESLKQQGRKKKVDPTKEFTLCTVHGAKGLEWERVYMCDDFPCLDRLLWGLAQARLPADQRGYYKHRYPMAGSCDCEGYQCRDGHAARLLSDAGLVIDPDRGGGQTDLYDDDVAAAINVEKIQEEVHVYYVAMTRAQRVLYANASLAPLLRPLLCATDDLRSQQASAFFGRFQ